MNYIGNNMRPGVSLSDLGWCPEVSLSVLGLSNRPFQLSTSYSFYKNLLYFLSNQHLQSSRPYK